MAVPPGDGAADAAEDDAVGDELVDLVQIEAVVSCCPQAFETVCQCIGNGLSATCIDVGGNGYGNHRYGDTCTCHTPVQMDVICFTVGTDEVSERNETGNYRNHSKEHQGQGHRQRTLVGVRHVAVAPIACRLLSRLRAGPKDTIIKTEHIECCHTCNHCHNPSHDGAELEACRQDFIFGEESGERRNTCNGKASDEERDMCNGHILPQSAHGRHLVAVYGMDDATRSEEQQCLEHGVCEQVEHACHVAQSPFVWVG